MTLHWRIDGFSCTSTSDVKSLTPGVAGRQRNIVGVLMYFKFTLNKSFATKKFHLFPKLLEFY